MGERLFEFDVHFDGSFAWPPLRYERDIVLNMNTNKMGYHDFLEHIEKQRGESFNAIYFVLPQQPLAGHLIKIDGQNEIDMLFHIGYMYGKLHIYLDHFMDDLTEFLVVPSKPNDGDVEDEFDVAEYLISQSQPAASLGVQSQVGGQNDNVRVENDNARVEINNVGDEHENAGVENDNVGGENDNIGGENDNVGGENENAGSGNENAGSENDNAGSENDNAGSGNENTFLAVMCSNFFALAVDYHVSC
uniref:uncharacterized protein LOC122586819 n=1 Tax=Erigeron canadensis TaxID=72917 RepID=UPI001CB8EC42|nr:uncharacterized protein LOC122586819 [Erigeron canadensis]